MNIVSACCSASIEIGSRTEYPLGGRTWSESFQVEICGGCGKEADPVHACGNCGAELNGDNPEIRYAERECCHVCLPEVVRDMGVGSLEQISSLMKNLMDFTEGGQIPITSLSELGFWVRWDAPKIVNHLSDLNNSFREMRELIVALSSEKERAVS